MDSPTYRKKIDRIIKSEKERGEEGKRIGKKMYCENL